VSYPTQEQPNEGVPQQPYGAPVPQPPYGAPAPQQQYGAPAPQQPYGAQPPYGAPTPQQPYGAPGQPYGAGYAPGPVGPQKNPLAIWALVLGILPTSIIGIVVSIIALVKSKALGGAGKKLAIAGLILSVLWTVGWVAVIVSAGKDVVSCSQVESRSQTLAAQLESDETSHPEKVQADLQSIVDELNDGAKGADSQTKADIHKFTADFQELASDLKNGTTPAPDLISRLTTDGNAVDKDCS
jgi:Domain of unknown function (DUF4190)